MQCLISALVGGLLVWVKVKWNSNKEKDKALKGVTHDAFYRACREVKSQGYRTLESSDNLEHLHESYVALGMNGTGEALYQQCKELELVID